MVRYAASHNRISFYLQFLRQSNLHFSRQTAGSLTWTANNNLRLFTPEYQIRKMRLRIALHLMLREEHIVSIHISSRARRWGAYLFLVVPEPCGVGAWTEEFCLNSKRAYMIGPVQFIHRPLALLNSCYVKCIYTRQKLRSHFYPI